MGDTGERGVWRGRGGGQAWGMEHKLYRRKGVKKGLCREGQKPRTQREPPGLADDEDLGWQEGWRCQGGAGRPEFLATTPNEVANQERGHCQPWGLPA